jgi:DNA-binding transcriptional MerR regulator
MHPLVHDKIRRLRSFGFSVPAIARDTRLPERKVQQVVNQLLAEKRREVKWRRQRNDRARERRMMAFMKGKSLDCSVVQDER